MTILGKPTILITQIESSKKPMKIRRNVEQAGKRLLRFVQGLCKRNNRKKVKMINV